MENFFSRYKNPLVLMLVLFIQVVGLATQVQRAESKTPTGGGGGPKLIRVWTVSLITPFEKAFTSTGHFFRNTWHNYIDLHDARKENHDLQEQLSRMKMEEVRLREESAATARLQNLLDFKQRYIGQTVPAQVIGTSGSDQSRLIYIDKGSHSGIKVDMPVITPDGIVGKIKEVFRFTSQVLLVNDHDSGAGVVLQNSRLQGILRGTPQGQLIVTGIMSDEKIDAGERIVTSGGDRIYPKGVPVGVVTKSVPDMENDPFLRITIKPAANLDKLEEVLVVTSVVEESPSTANAGPQRAADILAQRLPSAKQDDKSGGQTATGTPTPTPAATPASTPQPKTVVPPPATGTPGAAAPGLAAQSPATRTPAIPSSAATGSTKQGLTKQSPSKEGLEKKGPAKPVTASPGTAAPGTPGTGAAAPANAGSGTAAPGTSAPGKKKSPDQKKPASTGTPSATPNSTTVAKPATTAVPAIGASPVANPGNTKKKGPPKPTPTPAAADAPPAETPEPKKPEPEATPTPPPTSERTPR